MKLRNTLIKTFSLVFAVCTAFAIATMPSPAKAETANFSMVQGASIRNEQDGIMGLKFQSTVNASWLTENNAEKYTFGTLIYPASNNQAFDSEETLENNIENLDAVSITHIENVKITAGTTFNASIVYDEDVIKGVIEQKGLEVTDELVEEILFNLYNKDFTARSYAVIGEDVVYTDAYTTSMHKVAIETYELGVKEENESYKTLALNFLGSLSEKTATVSDEIGILKLDDVDIDSSAVIYDKNGLLKYGVDYVVDNGNVLLNVNYVSSKITTTENLYLLTANSVVRVLVTYENLDVTAISVELKDANAEYVRTDDICDYLTLKIVYNDNTTSAGYNLSSTSVKSVVIDNGVATVTVEIAIANMVYQGVVTLPVSDQPSTVSQVLGANVGGEYLLSGVVVSFATTIDGNEVVLMDKQTKDLISVTNLGKGKVYSGSYYLNGVEIGDEISIPVTLRKNDESLSANSNKLYAEFTGGSLTELSVISKNNAVSVTTEQVIDSNADLQEFLSAENRELNAYKVVKLRGELNFVMDGKYESYNFWFYDKAVNKTEEIAVDGLVPTFSNPSTYLTTGKMFGEIIFGNSFASSTDVKKAMTEIKEITAIYLGGNDSYAQFIILDESAVVDVTPTITSKDFVEPKQLVYVLGDELNFDGSSLTYNYDIRSSVTFDVTADMVKNMPVIDAPGNYSIIINDGAQDFEFTIQVISSRVKSIEILAMPNKSEYSHRDTFDTLDVTGGKILVTYEDATTDYIDVTKEMINLEESDDWKLGTVNYTLYYAGFKFTLPIVYKNTALTVSQFKAGTIDETYDVTGIVTTPIGTGSPEFLLKDKNSDEVLSILYTGIVGTYDKINLDTSVVNLGDEIIIKVQLKQVTANNYGNKGKFYGHATDVDTFKSGLQIVSSNNNYKLDLNNAVTISNQDQLIEFLGTTSTRPFFKMVKLVGFKLTYYTARYSNLYFGDFTKAAETKCGNLFVVLDRTTTIKYLTKTKLNSYFGKDITSKNNVTTFADPAVTSYEVYAMFTGGGSSYLNFVILEESWFVAPTVAE